RTGSMDRAQRKYRVEGATGEADVFAAAASIESATPTIAGLPFSTFDYQETTEVDGEYDLTVTWGKADKPPEQEIDTGEYRFNFQAPSAKIQQSLSTIAGYRAAGGTPRDFKGAINVKNDGDGDKVECVDLSPPPEVFTIVFRADDSILDGTYQLLGEAFVSKVN